MIWDCPFHVDFIILDSWPLLGYTGFIACLLHYPQNMTSIFSRSFWSRKTLIFFAICMMLMTVKMFYSFFLWDNSPVRLVTARALYQILHSSDLRSDYQVIDVRESKELIDLSIDGIGVINLPLSEKNSWRFKISQLNPMLPTICFCASGRRSILAAKYLVNHLGFKDVRSLEGGITGYVEIDQSVYHRRTADEKIEVL